MAKFVHALVVVEPTAKLTFLRLFYFLIGFEAFFDGICAVTQKFLYPGTQNTEFLVFSRVLEASYPSQCLKPTSKFIVSSD